jgi:hypothetical protein
MYVINLKGLRKSMCFLIAILSITFVIAQGITNNYLVSSVEGSQLLMKEPKILPIQDDSEDKEDSEDTQSTDNLPDTSNEGSSLSNTTGGGLSDGLTSGGSLLGDSNQTQGDMTAKEESDDNTNQTVQTENQVNQNVNQTQTTNQKVNVNQTNNQNVNVVNKQKLELIISEEEDEAPISVEEQTRIESHDKVVITQHRGITGPECKTGNVLAGASNAEDLRVLADCQDATGTVMHTKKMDDGDYKFFLNLDGPFKYLVNEKNNDKTEGFLVVEIVPADQNSVGALPKEGDHVHVWGAWVTDKPKGWHEIHPTWKVVVQ